MKPVARSAVFLDRDGTIIEDTHYPRDPSLVSLITNAAQGLRLIHEKGYLIFVVSNQSGVGRGIIRDCEFKAVHEKVCELLKAEKIEVAEFAYCFHHPNDDCACRKPRTGLIPTQFQGEPIAFSQSYVVGDKPCDLQLGDNLGGKSCLVLSGKGKATLAELSASHAALSYSTYQDLLQLAISLPELPLATAV